jgi:hypothetical protein
MKLYFSLLMVILLAASCRYFGGKRVHGNGRITSRQVSIGNFNSIELSGAMNLHVRKDVTASVRIETDENLMELIEVHNDGNTLVVRPKDGYDPDPTKEIFIYAGAPEFRSIDVSGASEVTSDNILTSSEELRVQASGASEISMEVNVARMTTDVSGSSKIKLKGLARDFTVSSSGASDIRSFDLITDNARIDISGASEARVTANKTLEVEASGASDVRYRGNASVSQNSSGASSVRKEG